MSSPATSARNRSPGQTATGPVKPKQMPMTPWYSLRQLASTAVQVLISLIFAQRSDARLVEAMTSEGAGDIWKHTRQYEWINEEYVPSPRAEAYRELWIDFVADTGDGFNSTYAVAYSVAQETLTVKKSGGAEKLPRADILIFGGDQVYPIASQSMYQDKTIGPFQAALPWADSPPHLYAIPGNHDWYDSLVGFTRLFCSGRWFGAWRTQQTRSYFALQLPFGWWLIGTDIQLDSDVDAKQVEYFRKTAAKMQRGDKIILCNAEPYWIYEKLYRKYNEIYSQSNLKFIERIFADKADIKLYLSGDLHHYRRHENQELGKQKIVAGGGGAFLHPTHGPNVDELDDGFRLRASFPPKRKSMLITFGNLLFPFKNPSFGVLTALAYLMTAWVTRVNIGSFSLAEALRTCAEAVVQRPAMPVWLLITFLGIWTFTDTFSKAYRWIAGTIHGLTHLCVLFLISWQAQSLMSHVFRPESTLWWLLSGALVALGGYVVGPFVLGIYLLVSLNLFGHHITEAFSSMAIPDWKNFLRMKIDAQGLTIYPIGIRKVPRQWRWLGEGGRTSHFAPETPIETVLIEDPIRVAFHE